MVFLAAMSRGKLGEQCLTQARTEETRAAIYRRAKNGLRSVKLVRGGGIARLCAKQEGNTRSVFSGGVSAAKSRRASLSRHPRRNRSERFPQLLFAFDNHGHTTREVRSAGIGAKANVHQVGIRMLREVLLVTARGVFYRALRPG